MDIDKDSLKIGDYVTLKDVSLGCFLMTEGILNDDVCGIMELTSIHDALFCVHLQRQYSAARELHAFLEKYDMDPKNVIDISEVKYLQALERGRDNENALNDAYMKKKLGNIVFFGDVIQLYHVKSGKYLQVIPSKLARDERENVRIGLDCNGNAFSWLQVCPRFKIDREGDRILSNAEVYLKVAERGNEYVHSALRDPDSGSLREINCALETTSWKLAIYQSSSDTFNHNILMASQLVYISDPETKSYLSIASSGPETFEELESLSQISIRNNDGDLKPDLINDDAVDTNLPSHEHGNMVLIPAVPEKLDSNFLWMIETASFLVGGPVRWKTEKIRLKHLNTGQYLCIDKRMEYNPDGSINNKPMFVNTTERNLPDTLFSIVEVNSTAKYLGNEKAVQLGAGGVWMERGDVMEGSSLSFMVCAGKDKDTALSLMINRYSNPSASGKDDGEDDPIVDPSVRLKEPLDIFVGLASRSFIQRYYDMTELEDQSFANTIWPSAGRADVDLFKLVMDKIATFIQGYSASTDDQFDVTIAPAARKFRQSLFREQGILELLLKFINRLTPLFEQAEAESTKNKKSLTFDNSILLKLAHMVQSKCFTITYEAITENPENQMYVANFMPVFLRNLNSQPVAVSCVTEMLSKNLELQETKIGTREIQIFVDKLHASKVNTMYLRLLQACCSCGGDGVDGNQCKVATMLFSNTEDIFITMEIDFAAVTPARFVDEKRLYLFPPTNSEAVIRGEKLMKRGLPRISLSWLGNEPGSNIHIATIDELFGIASNSKGHDSKGKLAPHSFDAVSEKSASLSKEFVAMGEYFIAEMFLAAEMCLDRNYVAMHKLDPFFSFEALVTILKLKVSSDVKSAALRLLMCLHVDRDPQASTKIPCLTRSWSDIKKHTEPQLPLVEPKRRYAFGLIQIIVSDHLKEMSGRRWDELSQHMLKMLLTLVKFDFYGSIELMRDVIGPLIASLDRRRVSFVDQSEMAKSSKGKQAGNNSPTKSSSLPLLPGEENNDNEDENIPLFKAESDDGIRDDDSLPEEQQLKVNKRKETYRRFYERMESPMAHVISTAVLYSALGVDLIQIVAGLSYQDFTIVGLVEIGFLGVFLLELLLRVFLAFRLGEMRRQLIADPVNFVDLIVVPLNILLFFTSPMIDDGLSFIKAIRLVRLYKVLYSMNGAKIASTDQADQSGGILKDPARYSRAPILELDTMVEAVDVLAFMQKLIEDRNISLLLRYFYLWESGSEKRSYAQIFNQVIQDSRELSLEVENFETIMLDCLMFSYSPLVQSVLEVLMTHFSMRSNIIENARNIQLLGSSKREKQFRTVEQMLKQLEQCAETHELWGELESEDDKKTNLEVKAILKELTEMCRTRRFILEFDEDFVPDKEIQNLYRNLGCFEICMKVLGLLDSVEEDEDAEISEVGLNTRDLCLLCNKLLYWFLLSNPINQELAYQELDLFLGTLDDEIMSHLVIQAIFRENEALMRLVPHTHLADLVDRIVNKGKSHHYLTLFGSISNVGDKNIVENQFEIVKILTSPGRLEKVSCFFIPVSHPDYEQKRELMKEFLDSQSDLTIDDLPPLLGYHLMFLDVLSGCTRGKMNITTVEAKVQSVFSYVDILQSILDPGTITICKIGLSKFFYNSIIEVDLRIPGLEQSTYIWKLLKSFQSILSYAKDDIRKVEKLGWEAPTVSRQKIEYIVICILITGGFFSRYFDPQTFRFFDGIPTEEGEKVQISQTQANDLIISLFNKIKDVYDLDSPRLSDEMKEQIFLALEALNKSASKVIVSNLMRNTSNLLAQAAKEALSPEQKLLLKYSSFVDELSKDPDVIKDIAEENINFISLLEKLPKKADKVKADVRYENLIRKLIQHIRDNIVITETRKSMDARVSRTATWIIKGFRTMIENKMGMSIYERDEDGGLEQDVAAAPVVNALNECGATALCLDLIAAGIDERLQIEAIRLGVALLFKEGGALEVQGIMNAHLNKTNSELFFKQVRIILQKLQAWHQWHEVIILEEGKEPELPDEILLVRFLQLMCEGHFLPNQDIMREQPNNRVQYNLLDDFVNYLNCLSRIPCCTSTAAAIRLSATILEVIQGPCEGNQVHFTLNTELIETLNRINRAKIMNDCVEDDEIELKKTSIDIFQGLLEGQGEKSVVYERVLSVIHLDIIQMMSKGIITPGKIEDIGKDAEDEPEDKAALRTECIVLLQMLCNFKPSLYEELGISQNIEDIVGSGTAMIEVVWRGDVHRRFFHVPTICKFLAKSSKDALVENVDRSNAENKLIDFLNRSHDLYREVKHQQLLTEMNLSRVFSREAQNRATWCTFYLAIVINCLFIVYYQYDTDSGGTDVIFTSSAAYKAVIALNALQSFVAAFVLILNIAVRSPVIYQALEAEGHSQFYTVIYTALDPMTMYFFMYLVLTFFGLFLADYYLSFLLLDIVAKNATTRDILNAVIIPWKQLMMTVILAMFVNYIYAYFYFLHFRENTGGVKGIGVFPGNEDCHSLLNCFKFISCYGLRQGGGVGDVMNLSIGSQWIADFTYFLVVIIMLLNIIFGIIIDTFSSLRADKNNRLIDTQEICFICGIDKQVFDRASSEPDGFGTHVKVDHNMWNYLYYIFMLWEQDRDDDDGLEQYVRKAIEANEIIWFPLNKAIRLDQAATEEEETVRHITGNLNAYEETVMKKVSNFQSELRSVLDQIADATKQSYARGEVKNGIAKYLQEHAVVEVVVEETFENAKEALQTEDDADNEDATFEGPQESIVEQEGSIESLENPSGLLEIEDGPGDQQHEEASPSIDSVRDENILYESRRSSHSAASPRKRASTSETIGFSTRPSTSDSFGFPSRDVSFFDNSEFNGSKSTFQAVINALEHVPELAGVSSEVGYSASEKSPEMSSRFSPVLPGRFVPDDPVGSSAEDNNLAVTDHQNQSQRDTDIDGLGDALESVEQLDEGTDTEPVVIATSDRVSVKSKGDSEEENGDSAGKGIGYRSASGDDALLGGLEDIDESDKSKSNRLLDEEERERGRGLEQEQGDVVVGKQEREEEETHIREDGDEEGDLVERDAGAYGDEGDGGNDDEGLELEPDLEPDEERERDDFSEPRQNNELDAMPAAMRGSSGSSQAEDQSDFSSPNTNTGPDYDHSSPQRGAATAPPASSTRMQAMFSGLNDDEDEEDAPYVPPTTRLPVTNSSPFSAGGPSSSSAAASPNRFSTEDIDAFESGANDEEDEYI